MSAAKFSFQMNETQISEGIASVKRRSASVRRDIHKMCVSVGFIWFKNRDAKTAARLATEIVNSIDYHAQAVADWFTGFYGFQWDAENKEFTYTRTTISEEDLKAAKATSFEEFSPPKPVKAMDILKELDRLISRADNRLKAPEEKRSDEDKVSPEEVDALRNAKHALEALRG